MITPETLAKCGTEHGHQSALFCWAALNLDKYPQLSMLFAIPNGGQRDKITAAKLKAEGVKSGVPDIMLPVARFGCHGLFIELKKPKAKLENGKELAKGRTSNNQDTWIAKLKDEGYGACVCYGWNEARQVLEDYLC